MDFLLILNEDIKIIEDYLKSRLDEIRHMNNLCVDAMAYSLMSPGKRLRPVFTLEFCKALGGDTKKALPLAAAVEMVHAYSLIHDDLPAMDNDDYRRGLPTCHKKFGEGTAILAGDALLNLAMETIMSASEVLGAKSAVDAGTALFGASGIRGMVSGQSVDLSFEGKEIGEETLLFLHEKKTCALFMAACALGCIAAGGSAADTEKAKNFAQNFGMAFQIKDDILDVEGDFKNLGKSVGKDEKSKKNTYVSVFGMEKSKEDLKKYTSLAQNEIAYFKSPFLSEISIYLMNREK